MTGSRLTVAVVGLFVIWHLLTAPATLVAEARSIERARPPHVAPLDTERPPVVPLTFGAPAGAPAAVQSNTAIIFLGGYNTGFPAADTTFTTVQSLLIRQGWQTSQFLTYSYTGGTVQNDIWVPNAYDCTNTGEGIQVATSQLQSMLGQYRAAHPNTSFVLVGHSLGGNIALAYASGVARASYPDLGVTGIVTIDAPLLGISAEKAFGLGLGCFQLKDQTSKDLAAIYQHWPAQLQEDNATVAFAAHQGVRIITIGNQNDCLYWANNPSCANLGSTWADDRFSQYIPAVQSQYTVPVDPSWGDGFQLDAATHFAILNISPFDEDVASTITTSGRGLSGGT